jgi:hypothetical protein
MVSSQRSWRPSNHEGGLTSASQIAPLRSPQNRERNVMLRTLAIGASVIALASCATPPAATTASGYDARIIRDAFGVPHIYGKRHADVAFGLAYAHAEDDWKNIEEVIRSSRGTLAEIVGESGAKSDDFILALGNTDIVNRDYDAKVSPAAKAIAEGYAAGINTWCAEHPETGCARSMPFTGRDIVAGFVNRPTSFYGLDGEIDALISGRANMEMSTKTSTRASLLDTWDDILARTPSQWRPRARRTATRASPSTRISRMKAASPGMKRA